MKHSLPSTTPSASFLVVTQVEQTTSINSVPGGTIPFVELVVSLNITAADFTYAMQHSFRAAVASAAGVLADVVVIFNIRSPGSTNSDIKARRLPDSTGIEFNIWIIVHDLRSAARVAGTLTIDNLNTVLCKMGLPLVKIVRPAQVVMSSVSFPTTSESFTEFLQTTPLPSVGPDLKPKEWSMTVGVVVGIVCLVSIMCGAFCCEVNWAKLCCICRLGKPRAQRWHALHSRHSSSRQGHCDAEDTRMISSEEARLHKQRLLDKNSICKHNCKHLKCQYCTPSIFKDANVTPAKCKGAEVTSTLLTAKLSWQQFQETGKGRTCLSNLITSQDTIDRHASLHKIQICTPESLYPKLPKIPVSSNRQYGTTG